MIDKVSIRDLDLAAIILKNTADCMDEGEEQVAVIRVYRWLLREKFRRERASHHGLK